MIDEFKICKNCFEKKPLEFFHRHTSMKFKRCNICKKFHHVRTIKWRKENRDKTPAYSRASSYKSRYGITIKQYEELVKIQERKCLICKNLPKPDGPFQNRRLHVDHCHKTGKIRGLLCHLCNRGIGLFRERIDLIEKCLEYLKSH